MRGLVTVLKVLVLRWSCLSWITSWSLLAHCCYLPRFGIYFTGMTSLEIMFKVWYLIKIPLLAQDAVTPLSENEAIDLVKTCFASATERDIYTVSLFVSLLSPCFSIFYVWCSKKYSHKIITKSFQSHRLYNYELTLNQIISGCIFYFYFLWKMAENPFTFSAVIWIS